MKRLKAEREASVKESWNMSVRICSAITMWKADEIQSILEERGLHPLPVRASPHVFAHGADQAYYVEVPDSEAGEAKKFLTGIGDGRDLL